MIHVWRWKRCLHWILWTLVFIQYEQTASVMLLRCANLVGISGIMVSVGLTTWRCGAWTGSRRSVHAGLAGWTEGQDMPLHSVTLSWRRHPGGARLRSPGPGASIWRHTWVCFSDYYQLLIHQRITQLAPSVSALIFAENWIRSIILSPR